MKLKIVLFLLVFTFVFSSCVSFSVPIDTNKSFPPDGRFEILGEIDFKDEIWIGFWGLLWYGGAGYNDLLTAARDKYGAVDDVVNISEDRHNFSALGFISIIQIKLRGTAIRYLPKAE